MLLSKQLPQDIFASDSESFEITTLTLECVECKQFLNDRQLAGKISMPALNTVEIKLDCVCMHCKTNLVGKYRFYAHRGGKITLEQWIETKWIPTKLDHG